MKVSMNLTIDHEVKAKAQKIIQQKMNSTLSFEVENYLKELIALHKKRKRK